MNHDLLDETTDLVDSTFVFYGNWKDFAKIVFPNFLLTILSLGIYRFWAISRERQYLWGQSGFGGDRLEWRGTGKELLIGFVLVLILFGVPYFGIGLLAQSLSLQDKPELALALLATASLVTFYLSGIAIFRALRYRLSRTYWRGVRGGSDNPGFGYGLSYLWKTAIGILPFGLLIPWSMTSLWNERWNKMSYGQHQFVSFVGFKPIWGRYLLFYIYPLIVIAVIRAYNGAFATMLRMDGVFQNALVDQLIFALMVFLVLMLLPLFGLIYIFYYSLFFEEAMRHLQWQDLSFGFYADTGDWVKLFLVDLLLVIGTLGIGYLFLSYRHWKFFITHLQCWGEIELDQLHQSETRKAGHGEGLLDAFDVGAI